jgi:GR25 family glycosyltransferase involved in LPS biosynthesis
MKPLDKNKSVYKLEGFGPIFYLNLDRKPDRKAFIETQFDHWGITNYERISAYDGTASDLSEHLIGCYPTNVTSQEIGCLTSHLKAIKHWLDNYDTPYAVFMEDDCIIDNAKYWNFTWKEFIAHAPIGWDCIQLAIICTGDIHVVIHNRFVNDFSTCCYVITRRYGQKLVDLFCKGDKFKLDQNVKPRIVSDDLIYNTGLTFATPLFLYNVHLGSDIHEDHVDIFHKRSYDGLKNFWQNAGSQLTVEQITNYDPYLSRISKPTMPEEQPST